MQNKPHYLRRLRRLAFYSLAAFVVLLAVLMSIARVVVSEADNWRLELEKLGSLSLDRKVYIKSLDARLDGITPVLILKNVRLMNSRGDTELFSFDEGKLELNIIDSIRTRTFIPLEFTIRGAEITVIRHRDKSFSFKGMELKNYDDASKNISDSDEFSDWLLHRSNLNVKDSTIIWVDLFNKQAPLKLDKVNIHLHNNNDHHQLRISTTLPETLGRSLEFAVDAYGEAGMQLSDWRGRIYLRGAGIHPARLGMLPVIDGYKLVAGVTDFELWGEWNRGELKQLSGDLAAYNLTLQHPQMRHPLRLKLLSGLFDYQMHEGDWSLDINRFHLMDGQDAWPETRISIRADKQPASDRRKFIVQAERFRLENISQLLLHTALLSEQQTDMLASMQPSADVENFMLRFSDEPENKDIDIRARFSQLGFNPWKNIPGVHGLNGRVNSEHGRVKLELNSDYAVFDFPGLFRQPLNISMLAGLFELQGYEQGWRLATKNLQIKNDDMELGSQFMLDIPDNAVSPLMDLQVQFNNVNAAQTSRYLPVAIMSSALVDWLDRGIVSGRISQGGVVFLGRLDDFPFNKNEGQFQVEFEAENAGIDYLAGWPVIHDAHLNAGFTAQGMDIQADSGRIFGSRLRSTSIRIDNFQRANLLINGVVTGTLSDALRFLVESPIQPQAKPLLDSFQYHGRSEVKLALSIPLSDEAEKIYPLSVNGQVQLRNAELLMLDDLIDITDINGRIACTQDTQTANGIQARIMGNEASIDITAGEKAQDKALVISGRGKLDSQQIAQKFGLPAWRQINGKTDWRGNLTIQPQHDGKAILQIHSQLAGVEIKLPQPLGKGADELREAMLEITLGAEGGTRIYARSKDYVSGAVLLNTEVIPMRPLKAYLHFGKGEGYLPDTESLYLSGSLSMFSITPWVDALKQGRDEVTHSFVSLPLVFDMDAVQLAPVTDDDKDRSENEPVRKVDVDGFPLIQGTIKALSYDDVPIGRVEIQTSRLKLRKGIQLDSLVLQGRDLNMQASGEWVQWPNREFSSLEVKLESPDLGEMLSSLGFSAIFQGGKTTLEGPLHWANSPMGVSLSGIKSKLKYTVKDGSIVSVEPGAGRLLGLFSLAALPRRLILDFSDAFGDGLHFDTIEGELDIHDGNVFMTDNLMTSPLAYISVSGRTGLVERDFDQLITVKPRGGDALTAVAGGMLFGPQIGAAILLVQKILGNELEDATAIKYRVTGSWEDPVITRLGKPPESEEPSLEEDEF